MNEIVCKYCGNEFATEYNLKKHMKTTKYCLQKRGKKVVGTEKTQCEYCSKIILRSDRLKSHYSVCKAKLEKEVNNDSNSFQLKLTIIDLEKQIINLNQNMNRLENKVIKLKIERDRYHEIILSTKASNKAK